MKNCVMMMKRYVKVNNIHIGLLHCCDFQTLPCETLSRCLALNLFCIHHHIRQKLLHVFMSHTHSGIDTKFFGGVVSSSTKQTTAEIAAFI